MFFFIVFFEKTIKKNKFNKKIEKYLLVSV